MNRRRRLARRLLSAVAVAAVAALLTSLGLSSGAFRTFQDLAVDQFFPSAKTDPAVVVVGMDDASVNEFGGLPWERTVHAQIARRLGGRREGRGLGRGVRAAAGQHRRPSRTGGADRRARQRDREHHRRGHHDDPRRDGRLGASARFDPADPSPTPGPTSEIGDVASVIAHVKVENADSDGVVRTVPLIVETKAGQLVSSLSLAAVLAYRGAQLQPVFGPKGVQAGGRFVRRRRTPSCA